MTETVVERDGGGWTVDVAGRIVNQCIYDFAFKLGVGDTPPHLTLVVETPFVLRTAGGVVHRLDPGGEPAMLAPTLTLLRRTVTAMVAAHGGQLVVRFADGDELTVAPDPDFEAWQVTGPTGVLIVCAPGGELVTWPSTPEDH